MELHLNSIIYEYPSATEPILNGVSVTFKSGWTGIIGDNGCGKTTLARIATGQLQPESGQVTPSVVTAYCEQDSSLQPPALDDFGSAYDRHAIMLRTRLGIGDDWPYRFDTLSSGQKKRLQVAVSLWQEADLLVMDEPTNHVDATTRQAIAHALGSYRGIGLLISHDRDLLDHLCKQCLFFAAGDVVMRPGGYEQGTAQASLERKTAVHDLTQARRELQRIGAEAQKRRQLAERTAARRSGRNLDRHDSSGREKLRLAVISGQDGKAGRLSARMDARLETAATKLGDMHVDRRYDGDVWMDAHPSRRKILLHLDSCSLPLGEEKTLSVPELFIGNDDHVGLVGDNGSGKTTLVHALASALPQDVPHLFIPQDMGERLRKETIGKLQGMSDGERGRVFSIIAQLNSDPDRLRRSGNPSPGEMRKLLLAQGILGKPSLIVMDEPTNHLDIGSIEALQRLLAGFPGALLLVSHDRALIDGTTSIVWSVDVTDEGNFLSIGSPSL